MTGNAAPKAKPGVLKFCINEFAISELPASIKARWAPFSREVAAKERRARALKGASHTIYRVFNSAAEVCLLSHVLIASPSSTVQLHQKSSRRMGPEMANGDRPFVLK